MCTSHYANFAPIMQVSRRLIGRCATNQLRQLDASPCKRPSLVACNAAIGAFATFDFIYCVGKQCTLAPQLMLAPQCALAPQCTPAFLRPKTKGTQPMRPQQQGLIMQHTSQEITWNDLGDAWLVEDPTMALGWRAEEQPDSVQEQLED